MDVNISTELVINLHPVWIEYKKSCSSIRTSHTIEICELFRNSVHPGWNLYNFCVFIGWFVSSSFWFCFSDLSLNWHLMRLFSLYFLVFFWNRYGLKTFFNLVLFDLEEVILIILNINWRLSLILANVLV